MPIRTRSGSTARPPAARSVQQGVHGALMGITTKTAAGTDPIHQLLHRLLIFAAAESLHQVDPALSAQLRKILDTSREVARSPDPRPAPAPLPSRDEQVVDGERPHLFKHPDQLLTAQEFCDWTKVTRRTLRQWEQDGSAPKCIKLMGRHIRYRWGDCLAWAESYYVND